MDENKIISEANKLCYLFDSYQKVLSTYINVQSDENQRWCKEDKTMEFLRKNAETALECYMKALHGLYFDGIRNFPKKISSHRIPKIFRKQKEET